MRVVATAILGVLLLSPAWGEEAARSRPAGAAADGLVVKLMTFNIRYDNAGDGADRWSNRRAFAAEIIRTSNCDFVGLQEALPRQLADLGQTLQDYARVERTRDKDPRTGEASPILYRRDRWRLDETDTGTFWLSRTPQEPGSITPEWGNVLPRIVTWGRFVHRATGQGLYVFNTHLSHMSPTARRKSAELIAQRIAARKRPEPACLTGDFNAGPTSREIGYLTGSAAGAPLKLTDTFAALHPKAEHAGTFHRFKGDRDAAKIDYILVTPSVVPQASEIRHDARDGRYPSDHFPVTAEVRLPRAR